MPKPTIIILTLLLFFVTIVAVFQPARDTLSFLFQLLFQRDVSLQIEEGRVNVLLLGNAGGNHDGANLTDTIIVLSIDQDKREALFISIPRDLWIPKLQEKINTAYTLGEGKQEGGGLTLAKAVVREVTGLSIQYAVKMDFEGFTKAVDSIGGLIISVEQPLLDEEYPIDGKENDLCGKEEEDLEQLSATISAKSIFPCRFESLILEKGKQHMDGALALKYVRSRNAKDAEGTDFARSRRQQKVLSAFSDKIFSIGILLNPFKVQSLFSIVKEHVESDANTSELDDFIRLAKTMQGTKIQNMLIDYGDEKKGRVGLLINPPISEQVGLQWVLIPRIGNGDFSEIQEYVDCQISSGDCKIQSIAE